MNATELQSLVDACRVHAMAMATAVADLKEIKADETQEPIPENYAGYVDGAYQTSILNLFRAGNLLEAALSALK